MTGCFECVWGLAGEELILGVNHSEPRSVTQTHALGTACTSFVPRELERLKQRTRFQSRYRSLALAVGIAESAP
jgi:hypothetical protein